MSISEEKTNIVINNYFKTECSIDTTIREAFEKGFRLGMKKVKAIENAPTIPQWIPCAERMPNAVDCPMDCMVTRRSKYVGNYTDMAVAEADGTWAHEDWNAIVLGDVESGRKTGLISTHDDEIIAWMPLIQPYREEGEA